MPLMSPFRPKAGAHEAAFRVPDRRSAAVNNMTLRATQKAVDNTMRRARIDKLVTTEPSSASSSSAKKGIAPPVNVGWGSLDPSIPKKVSISRRTLHPAARDPSAAVHFQELDEIDAMPDFSEENEYEDDEQPADVHELQTEIHEMEGSPVWHSPPLAHRPRRSHGTRPSYTRRRSSSAPPRKPYAYAPPMSPSRRSESPNSRWAEDDFRAEALLMNGPHELMSTPPVPPKNKHSKSLNVPVSKFAYGAPLDRRHRTARKPSRAEEETMNTYRSSVASVETVYIALDQQSVHSSPIAQLPPVEEPEQEPEDEPEINPNMDRAERHQANKQLYYKMKAENHNLWVLLDASNRRADLMMQNLTAEEMRCRDLEYKTHELQATLDTLNARRLWLQQEDDDYDSNASSRRNSLQNHSPSESTAEIQQVTAELESLRRNLDHSRQTVKKMKSFTEEARLLQRETLPTATKLLASQRGLGKSLHDSLPIDASNLLAPSKEVPTLFTPDELEARLRDLIKPTPVRPGKSSISSSNTPTSVASRTPTRSPHVDQNTPLARSVPPRSEARQLHELDATETATGTLTATMASTMANTIEEHRVASMKEAFEVSEVEIHSSTPDLSPSGSRLSSGADSTSSGAPSPPPKSTRRPVSVKTSQSNIRDSQSDIHPALRMEKEATAQKEAVPLVMAPLLEAEAPVMA